MSGPAQIPAQLGAPYGAFVTATGPTGTLPRDAG